MLTRALSRSLESVLLCCAGGDAIRADALRTRLATSFLTFVALSYLPLMLTVVLLVVGRPQPVNEPAERDQLTAVAAYATGYVDTYLKDPSNTVALKHFYDGDIPTAALPAGGHALRVASCLPGSFQDGFHTYSVVVDAEIPKAANAAAMVPLKLQVDIAADDRNRYRAFTLPHARPERPPGRPVQLATQTQLSDDRPAYKTAAGFLAAMLTGHGDLTPYVAADAALTAEQPPQFTTMRIEAIHTSAEAAAAQNVPPSAEGIEVTVRAVVQTASGVLMPMDFPLVMSVAAGHWQVNRINDAPSILTPTPPEISGLTTSPITTSPTPSSGARIPAPRTPEGS
jgi:hypothetical protein